MQTAKFDYALPPHRIAQSPAKRRTASRLLCLGRSTDEFKEIKFADLNSILCAGDVLVVNDTQVVAARLSANKLSGGKVEVLLERLLDNNSAVVQLRANKPLRATKKLLVAEFELQISGRDGDFFIITSDCDLAKLFAKFGRTPLPPYIKRRATADDVARYQTVYARNAGAVAAPTAGLHFDEGLIDAIKNIGVSWITITLHIGAGTFQPVRSDNAACHKMHREYFNLTATACKAINAAKARGGRIIAVGTTVVRALETAAVGGQVKSGGGDTELFILPGYKFNIVDALLTNFHLPRSTLLMLVCAFGGYERVMRAYRYALNNKFRFYSYGDAMFLELNQGAN